jgi:hypothetical protein
MAAEPEEMITAGPGQPLNGHQKAPKRTSVLHDDRLGKGAVSEDDGGIVIGKSCRIRVDRMPTQTVARVNTKINRKALIIPALVRA